MFYQLLSLFHNSILKQKAEAAHTIAYSASTFCLSVLQLPHKYLFMAIDYRATAPTVLSC
jgi:hypothetical protein